MERPFALKTIGILGGMSDRATIEYYDLINKGVNDVLGGWDIAETLIVGCNFGNIEYFVRQGKWDLAQAYLLDKAKRAQAAGADVLICMSNTMHKVLIDIQSHITIPFIHIATPTAKAIKQQGLTTVGLLGTLPVMSENYMVDEYRKANIDIIRPTNQQQILIDRIIFDELVKNQITEKSKQAYIAICEDLRRKGAQGVILGCTEIFLLIKPDDFDNFPLFNTTQLHVDEVVTFAVNNIDLN